MTRWEALGTLLSDVDDLLLEADDQTVTESLERELSPEWRDTEEMCPWCFHGWHGLACAPPPGWIGSGDNEIDGDHLSTVVSRYAGGWSCQCTSSLEPQTKPVRLPARRVRFPVLSEWTFEPVLDEMAESFRRTEIAVRQMHTSVRMEIRNVSEDLLVLLTGDVSPCREESPLPSREAILERVRARRGTGPERVPAGRLKRPRRHE